MALIYPALIETASRAATRSVQGTVYSPHAAASAEHRSVLAGAAPRDRARDLDGAERSPTSLVLRTLGTGSITVAAFIARIAFPVLLAIGWFRGDIGLKGTVVFIVLATAAYIVFPRVASYGDGLITSGLAVLDIALVFMVFKGDVRIT